MLQYHMLSSFSNHKTAFYSADRSVLIVLVYTVKYETKYEAKYKCGIIIPIMDMI